MLAPWKESYDKPRQCIKKQRHHFADKGLYNKSYSFSSDTLSFYFHNLKETNKSVPKEINSEYSLEGLMLKLKLQYFGHLM